MSNVIIKILDLIHPFQSWYETLKQEYEKNVMACITNEKWNDIFQETFGGDTCNWLRALALASIKENKYIGKFDFVEDSEITYGIDSNPIKISESGFTRNLSPCCIPSFWGDNISENIMKLIACFNESDKERRIFNEVHCYAGDTTITIGMGHFAAENVGEFFREMPEQIWKEMRDCIQECINGNKNILTDKKNTNIHSDYKTQFWNDYVKVVDNDPSLNENDKKSKTQKEGSITTEHLDYFFRNEKNKDDKKIKNQIKIRCDAAYKEIMADKSSLWGKGNVLKHNMLLYRFAMKDTYETKARRYYECAVKRNLSTPQLTVDIDKLKDSKISETHGTGITSLEGLRKKLEDLSKKPDQIKYEDYDIYLKIFDSGIDSFNKDLDTAGKALSKALNLGDGTKNKILVGDKVDKHEYNTIKEEVLQPYPGNQEYSGYWFYDIMKVALRLRSVCYYQLIFWLKHVLESGENSDAAIAACSSWGSSRFPFVRDIKKNETKEKETKKNETKKNETKEKETKEKETKKILLSELVLKYNNIDIADLRQNYLLYKNGSIVVGNEVDENILSKALMYWQNYNVLRAWDEENNENNKVEIRGRQKQIWKVWFSPYYTLPQNGYKATLGQLPTPIENPRSMPCKIREELEGYIEFLRRKEPALKNYVLKKIPNTESENNSNNKTK